MSTSPPQQLVSKDWYEVREEVGRHAVGENEAELALHPATGHFEEPGEGLGGWGVGGGGG